MDYPSDIDEATYNIIRLLLEVPSKGRPRKVNLFIVLNGILYITRSGEQWRMLPKSFPPWQTVYYYFRKWKNDGTWTKIMQSVTAKVREQEGKGPRETGSIDSQSTKGTPMNDTNGYDAFKKVKGRKRHILVDSMGLILCVFITAANMTDAEAGQELLKAYSGGKHPGLKQIFVDGIYQHNFVPWIQDEYQITGIVCSRPPESKGFTLIKGRWVVERTFGWLGWYRRTNREYERTEASSKAFVEISMISVCLRRLAGIKNRFASKNAAAT